MKLADCPLESDFNFSYRVDQIGRGARQNSSLDLGIVIPSFDLCAGISYEQYFELIKTQLEGLLPEVLEIQRNIWIKRIILPHWKRAAAIAANRELTIEEHREVADAITAAIVRELEPSIREASRRRRAEAEAEFQKLATESGDKGE